ncbi:GDSL family lipase [Segetibacter sp. 3557_3]|uniref:GDSL-type esterase/lipase family protein n=1 Tax=Segetibacter sp. 3557_3 TaxID=2547429 RepID=UPI001058ABFE|nr:GDSL-type esterase/lipase family protein [Segetibacter sp. 3557_3]TDH29201.1 GDSL family lipase [Segetibacter sp. 3557_3]
MFWYEDEVKRLEEDLSIVTEPHGVVFYGSSSIRLWDSLQEDFADYAPVNTGFGGSTLAACGWFFNRIFTNLNPKSIILYAGDNDLGDGRHPEEVFLFFKELVDMIHERYGDIPLGFISIKPSFTRWDIVDKIRYTNKLIEAEINRLGRNMCFINVHDKMTDKTGYPKKEYLDPDGLHINEKGYALWKETIMESVRAGEMKLFKLIPEHPPAIDM